MFGERLAEADEVREVPAPRRPETLRTADTDSADSVTALLAALPRSSERIRRFVHEYRPPTPFLVLDLEHALHRFRALREALPEACVYYAVKANPAPELIRLLDRHGACFDVASPAEIDLCLGCGVAPFRISYGNSVKKQADIAYAYGRGIRRFTFDSVEELQKLAVAAPGSSVTCRLFLPDAAAADWPLTRKFGCSPAHAVGLLVAARDAGLHASGLSFHVGSQQRDPEAWDSALALVAETVDAAAELGVPLDVVNLGGGFPAAYDSRLPALTDYASAIRAAVSRRLGDRPVELMIEPGRYIAADAGILFSEVVLVSRRGESDVPRWAYLDVGIFGGLAEALGEAIRYPIATSAAGDPVPTVLAGPTCDSMDILYEHRPYALPAGLVAGDQVAFLHAGAYTQTYASVGFNGFPPPALYCI